MNHVITPGRKTTWRPILAGDLRTRALQTAEEITSSLAVRFSPHGGDPSLAEGHAGVALLHEYQGRSVGDRRSEELAVDRLNASIDALASVELPPSLFGGYAGVAWTTAHLAGEEAAADQFEAIDEALHETLAAGGWPGRYDLISGLVGFGVYALARLPNPAATNCLRLVVERLSEAAEARLEGIAWLTRPETMPDERRGFSPMGEYDLGVAHGSPGAIALLAQCCAAGVAEDTARPLVERAVDWLLLHRHPESRGAQFGYDDRAGEAFVPSRTAWCYGDPGVAAALHLAGDCLGRDDWRSLAISIAVEASARPVRHTKVCDAGLCHGAAGLAHIYNRLYQASGEERLRIAAIDWCQRTLDYQRSSQEANSGVAGFLSFQSTANGGEWTEREGLLEGAAGIGLALLAAATPIEPKWDQVLLISRAFAL